MKGACGFVLLDRDGTIIEEREYLRDPDQVQLIPGAAEGLRRLRELGLGLIVLTNQSGIGRGYFDEADLTAVHDRLRHLLREEGVELDGVYVCPHRPEDACLCRKPRVGLVERAVREHHFSPVEAFVIGDKISDVELGRSVGATTVLVRTGYGATAEAGEAIHADYVLDHLADAAAVIQNKISSGLHRPTVCENLQRST